MKILLSLTTAATMLMTAGQAQATTFFSADGSGFTIPFGTNTQTSVANVASTGLVQNVTFTLDLLVHSSARDLTATVTHNGITANLFSGLSCCDGLFGTYAFSSSAGTPLADADGFLDFLPGTYSFTYPTGGSFLGGSAAGDWTLSIADSRVADGGLLSSWNVSGQLGGTPVSSAVPEPATWALLMIGFGAVGATMRRRNQIRVQPLTYAP